MGPGLSCVNAENWEAFENFQRRKVVGDFTALCGELDLALDMYECVRNATFHYIIALVNASRLLLIDTYLTEAHVYLNLQGRMEFRRAVALTLSTLKDYYDNLPDFTYQPATLLHITELIKLDAEYEGNRNVPLECINFLETSGVTQKPAHCVGWVDVRMLRQVHPGFRVRIIMLQKERLLPYTRWQEYPWSP